jgi:hypothetical protein
MSLELIVVLIVSVIVFSLIYFNRSSSSLDINQDGKIDVEDAKKAVENTVEGVKKTVRKPRATKATATKTKTTNGSRKK